MRETRHLINLFLLVIFAAFVLLPFSLTKVVVKPGVLGESLQREYYKKANADSEELMIRNLIQENNQERDMITVQDLNQANSYFPLYEIRNLSANRLTLKLYPGEQILGNLKGKKVVLKYEDQELIIYKDGNTVQGKPEIEMNLKPDEKVKIDLIVESSQSSNLQTPLSFDLILEKMK